MHKSYQSILPCQSRILKARWDQKYYDEHRDKVRDAKSMVDTKAPTTYVHLHLKQLQLEEERYAIIERDNRILLEKMSQIMRNKGRVDNHNNYMARSLNKEKRQKELLRVTRENQEILRRILAREPEYNHLQWERDWEDNEQFMDSIARYPRDWWERDQEEEERRKQELKERRKKEKKRSKTKKRSKSGTMSREDTSLTEEEDTETDGARAESPDEKTDKNNNEENSNEENNNDESRQENEEDENGARKGEEEVREGGEGDSEESVAENGGETEKETEKEKETVTV